MLWHYGIRVDGYIGIKYKGILVGSELFIISEKYSALNIEILSSFQGFNLESFYIRFSETSGKKNVA